eukprot:6180438-Pleurochrysis_carterae.AAC.1
MHVHVVTHRRNALALVFENQVIAIVLRVTGAHRTHLPNVVSSSMGSGAFCFSPPTLTRMSCDLLRAHSRADAQK